MTKWHAIVDERRPSGRYTQDSTIWANDWRAALAQALAGYNLDHVQSVQIERVET